jgi:hypothetical protein
VLSGLVVPDQCQADFRFQAFISACVSVPRSTLSSTPRDSGWGERGGQEGCDLDAAAEQSKTAAQVKFSSPIVTEIVPLEKFWLAEDYHQDFFQNNPRQPYCLATIPAKLKKLGLL